MVPSIPLLSRDHHQDLEDNKDLPQVIEIKDTREDNRDLPHIIEIKMDTREDNKEIPQVTEIQDIKEDNRELPSHLHTSHQVIEIDHMTETGTPLMEDKLEMEHLHIVLNHKRGATTNLHQLHIALSHKRDMIEDKEVRVSLLTDNISQTLEEIVDVTQLSIIDHLLLVVNLNKEVINVQLLLPGNHSHQEPQDKPLLGLPLDLLLDQPLDHLLDLHLELVVHHLHHHGGTPMPTSWTDKLFNK